MKVYWNGNGLTMLTEAERTSAKDGAQCASGLLTVRDNQMYCDQHVVATLVDDKVEAKAVTVTPGKGY